MIYSYILMNLARGAAPRQAFAKRLAARRELFTDLGGEILGFFTAQLGWEAAEAALLIRWQNQPDVAATEALMTCPEVLGHVRQRLVATLRPEPAATIPEGGIFVHRWFEIDGGDVDEFLKLSGEGWQDFEPRFDARVFGLFREEAALPDGRRRLLLITRYGDHGVWEESRDPSTAAMQTFGRRQALTKRTVAASTLLVPLG